MSYQKKKEHTLNQDRGKFVDLEYQLATGQISTHEYWKKLEEEYKTQWHYVNFLESFSKSV